MKKPETTPGGAPKDPDRININEEWELCYWAEQLGLEKDQLKRAVEEVGVLTKDLRKYKPPPQ